MGGRSGARAVSTMCCFGEPNPWSCAPSQSHPIAPRNCTPAVQLRRDANAAGVHSDRKTHAGLHGLPDKKRKNSTTVGLSPIGTSLFKLPERGGREIPAWRRRGSAAILSRRDFQGRTTDGQSAPGRWLESMCALGRKWTTSGCGKQYAAQHPHALTGQRASPACSGQAWRLI